MRHHSYSRSILEKAEAATKPKSAINADDDEEADEGGSGLSALEQALRRVGEQLRARLQGQGADSASAAIQAGVDAVLSGRSHDDSVQQAQQQQRWVLPVHV